MYMTVTTIRRPASFEPGQMRVGLPTRHRRMGCEHVRGPDRKGGEPFLRSGGARSGGCGRRPQPSDGAPGGPRGCPRHLRAGAVRQCVAARPPAPGSDAAGAQLHELQSDLAYRSLGATPNEEAGEVEGFENRRTNFPAWPPRHCCESSRDGGWGELSFCGRLRGSFLGAWMRGGRRVRRVCRLRRRREPSVGRGLGLGRRRLTAKR